MDPSGVVTSGFLVKNCTGYFYRGIFIMDLMGSYVPNTSRRVLGILVFFLLECQQKKTSKNPKKTIRRPQKF